MEAMNDFSDLSEIFDFDEESLDYVDEPLSGWLRSKTTHEWFVFNCQLIIRNLLWHWTLVPAADKTNIGLAVREASRADTGYWLSIVEDLRGPTPLCRAARIENTVARPVVFNALQRST